MSAAVAAAAAAALSRRSSETRSRSTPDSFYQSHQYFPSLTPQIQVRARPLISRYECQKRRDWDSFRKYLRNHRPTLSLARCSGANVIEFLCYLDEFGQTKVHADTCTNFGHLYPANPCACPARQPWSSLVALTNRLRVAFEENGGNPVTNPFNTIDVRVYLNEVKDCQDRSRGMDQYD